MTKYRAPTADDIGKIVQVSERGFFDGKLQGELLAIISTHSAYKYVVESFGAKAIVLFNHARIAIEKQKPQFQSRYYGFETFPFNLSRNLKDIINDLEKRIWQLENEI